MLIGLYVIICALQYASVPFVNACNRIVPGRIKLVLILLMYVRILIVCNSSCILWLSNLNIIAV
jgi:hypothetical protein